jgi:hypothetical protein
VSLVRVSPGMKTRRTILVLHGLSTQLALFGCMATTESTEQVDEVRYSVDEPDPLPPPTSCYWEDHRKCRVDPDNKGKCLFSVQGHTHDAADKEPYCADKHSAATCGWNESKKDCVYTHPEVHCSESED